LGAGLHARGVLVQLADGVLVLLAYGAFSRLIEKREPLELSLKGALAEWLAGMAIGLLVFAVTIGIMAAAGWYRPLALTWPGGVFAASLASCISTALYEETLVRGYAFRFMQSALGTWLAIALSSLLFGFLHAFNPGATLWTSLAIAIEAGILLGAAYVLTGRLWLAIGIHAAWNFSEGTIFGTIVSGTNPFASIVRARLTGPDWLTGGSFGPEGSIVTVLVCLALSAYFLTRIVREGRAIAPPWLRHAAHLPAAS
jgi:membrane protease YdiL (CAAX protease family)